MKNENYYSSAATQEAYHSGTHHQELLPRNAYARSNVSMIKVVQKLSIFQVHIEVWTHSSNTKGYETFYQIQ